MTTKAEEIKVEIKASDLTGGVIEKAKKQLDGLADSAEKATEKVQKSAEKATGSNVKLADSFKKAQEPIGKIGTVAGGLSAALGATNNKAGQLVGTLANMAGVIGATGPIGIAVAAATAGVGLLAKSFLDAEDAAKKMRKELAEGLAKSLSDTRTSAIATAKELKNFGKTKTEAALGEVRDEIKQRTLELNNAMNSLLEEAGKRNKVIDNANKMARTNNWGVKLVAKKMKEEVADLTDREKDLIKTVKIRAEQLKVLSQQEKDLVEINKKEVAVEKEKNAVMIETLEIADLEGKKIVERKASLQILAEENRLVNEMLKDWLALVPNSNPWEKTFKDAGDAAKYLSEQLDNIPLEDIWAIQSGIMSPGITMGPRGSSSSGEDSLSAAQSLLLDIWKSTSGGSKGADIASMFGLTGDAASAVTKAGFELTSGSGATGAFSAISAGAPAITAGLGAAAGPGALAGLGAATGAAITAPFIAAGAVAGEVFSSSFMEPVMSIKDTFLAALKLPKFEDAANMIAGLFDPRNPDSIISQMKNTAANIKPLLGIIINQLPGFIQSATEAFIETFISILETAPSIINSLIDGFTNLLFVVLDRLPDLLTAAIPLLAQALVFAIVSGIALFLTPVIMLPVAAAIVASIVNAFFEIDFSSAAKAIGDIFGDTLLTIIRVMIMPINKFVDDINELLSSMGIDFKVGKFPEPSVSGRASYGFEWRSPDSAQDSSGSSADSSSSSTGRVDIPTFDQFHAGGYIKAHSGLFIGRQQKADEVPIMALSGEAVLNRQAVQSIGGPAGVNAINRGGSQTVEVVFRNATTDQLMDAIVELLNRGSKVGRITPNGIRY